MKLGNNCLCNSALNCDKCRILTKISSFVRYKMILEGNNFMNVYNLRFFSLIRTHSYITNGPWLKYMIKKNIRIGMFAYRKNGFLQYRKTRADWPKWWPFLESECPNYLKKVVVHPATKWLLNSVVKQNKNVTKIIIFFL